MTSPYRIILLEDETLDADLIRELFEAEQFACEITCVQTRPDFLAALERTDIDLILADYKLPSFDGLSALDLTVTIRPDLPFIFVSGTLGEETAVDALQRGATDYILKSRLSRLVPCVQRALRENQERIERRKAEEALRRSERYLAEAQKLSKTGSFGWNIASGEIYWSDETYRIFECERTMTPSLQLVIDRTHPEDRNAVQQVLDRASSEGTGFKAEHRLRMPDGRVKYLEAVANRLPQGNDFILVGAVSDITERKHAERERRTLRQLEQEIARINRVSVMGELAASLAHELKQPISAVKIHAIACRRWLQKEPPAMEEVHPALASIIDAVDRAAQIIDRNRGLFGQSAPHQEAIDLNEVIQEIVAPICDLASHHSISVRCDLDPACPMSTADRVQLQQVLMNLMLNGIEAMEAGGLLSITSKMTDDGRLMVSVSDVGVGLPGGKPERVFEPFFTTKPHGTGTGLSISRRIIEAHGGCLWASPNVGRGATFSFTLPTR
ncbi:signal transduction histidine kinase/CheY-like chemotaxis protein [Rhizobium pisi]